MDNYIIKTLAYNKQVRILFMDNTDIIKKIFEHNDLNKLLKTSLAKTLSIASLISGTLKGEQRISLKVNSSNRKYKILADADSHGNVRGYINDELLNANLDYTSILSIEQLIGTKGYIQVMKDIGMNSIFTGITDMPYGNIVDDFSYYFIQSEQIATLFSLNIVFNENNEIVLSRGILAQLLPYAPVNLIENVKKIILDNQVLLSTPENDKPFKESIYSIFENIQILESNTIQFFCGCSKEGFYPLLYSLNKEEMVDAYENNKPIEIVCNVCGDKYGFYNDELKNFI